MIFEVLSAVYGLFWVANIAALSFANIAALSFADAAAQQHVSLILIIQCIALPVSLLSIYIVSRIEDYAIHLAAVILNHIAHIVYTVFITIKFYEILLAADTVTPMHKPSFILIWLYEIIALVYLANVAFMSFYYSCNQLHKCFHKNLGNHFNTHFATAAKRWRRRAYAFCGRATFWCPRDSRCYNCCDALLLTRCACQELRAMMPESRYATNLVVRDNAEQV